MEWPMPIPVAFVAFRVEELPRTHRSPERSFLAPFVAMPFAPSSVRSLLVVRPGAPGSVRSLLVAFSVGSFLRKVLFALDVQVRVFGMLFLS